MILVTSANAPFVPHANQLALSFLAVYDTRVIICIFGDNLQFEMIQDSRIEYLLLPKLVSHAYTPEFYHFKTAAIYYAAHSQNSDFIYLDSKFRFLGRAFEIESKLREFGRFFIQYPLIERLKNKYWSTLKCIELCGGEQFGDEIQYMAGLQAYTASDENRLFISHMLTIMNDPLGAGPSNRIHFPDGDTNLCIAHRNDQSVLTMMINAYGYAQPFDVDLTAKYGDRQTMSFFCPENNIQWNPTIELLPR